MTDKWQVTWLQVTGDWWHLTDDILQRTDDMRQVTLPLNWLLQFTEMNLDKIPSHETTTVSSLKEPDDSCQQISLFKTRDLSNDNFSLENPCSQRRFYSTMSRTVTEPSWCATVPGRRPLCSPSSSWTRKRPTGQCHTIMSWGQTRPTARWRKTGHVTSWHNLMFQGQFYFEPTKMFHQLEDLLENYRVGFVHLLQV